MANLQDHPRVMQRLREEQAAVQCRHGDAVTADALKDMRYADAVVRETLRRDPVVGGVIRVATRDLQLGGYGVPAGTNLLLPLRTLAEQDPRWASSTGELDPAAFNPDRMMEPEGAKQGQLMPFGGGARYCLGAALAMAEMKTCLALLARRYSFQADTDTQWKPALGYYPANGLPLVLTQLQQA
ncbi:cytochrome P450 [Scenedesmus sp. NREL 46B-D3]|nr:cytochrome P450 [Scenedesmus sp. NREL 46B-D3]